MRAGLILLAVAAGAFVVPGEALAQQRRCRPNEVQIAPPDANVQVGRTTSFLPTAYDNAGNTCADAVFRWRSNNPRVATVDANGTATGVGAGVAIITATTGTGAAARDNQVTIIVTAAGPTRAESEPPPRPVASFPNRPTGLGCAAWERQPDGSGVAEGLWVSPTRIPLVRGEARQLEYRTVRGSDSNATRACIVFEVDPTGARIASVDSFGLITAGSDVGQTRIRALAQGAQGRIAPRTVTVDVGADSVRFERAVISMSPGTSDTLRLVVPRQDNRPFAAAPGLCQFSSNNASVARVGLLRPSVDALQPGSAVVTADCSVFEPLSVTINVHRRVVALSATPADSVITIAIGGTLPLQVRALADDSSEVAQAPLTWTRPDSSVVRWDVATKTLRGLRAGQTTLSVSAPGRDAPITKHWRINVVAGGLAVSKPRVGLGAGERVPLSVQLLDDAHRPIGLATDLTWSSSNDSVARLQDGQVVAGRLGHAVLTATARWESTTTVEAYVVGDMIVSAQRAGRWDLFMMTGTTATPLTSDSALESQVAWSPDLTRIAYVAAPSPRSADFQLYVANSDGTGATRITRDSASVGSPSWVRPVGDQIVFEATRGGRGQLYMINKDGTGLRALTSGDNPNTAPDASPDGRKIVFVSLRESSPGLRNYDIFEMNIDGTGERRLTTSPRRDGSPAYTSDGHYIYFLRDEGAGTQKVYRIDTSTGAEAPVTQNGTFVRAFSVSADQSTLALTLEQQAGEGASTTRVMIFMIASGLMTPLPSGPDERIATPAYRPNTPR